MPKTVRLETNEQWATLWLDHEPGNLLTIGMMEEINDALQSLREEQALEVLVLRGANGVFSDGWDLKEHMQRRVQRLLQIYARIFETLRMMNVVTIAAVEGRANGAGFELALGCNMIVASDAATFALPQVGQGLMPPVAAAILPRIAPRRKAMEWILTGAPVGADELAELGVVNRVFPAKKFQKPLEALVGEITSKSGPVLQLAKRAQMEAYYATFPQALASIQALYLRELMELQDAKEGPKAVREGREPQWKNA
jgi:enoyl-CoA hydratase/carnithine racemase